MTPPKCRVCGLSEWRHVCARPVSSPSPSRASASNLASNGASNSAKSSAAKGVGAAVVRKAAKAIEGMKQRWAREDYNAYQRELMRRRRAVKRLKTGFST